MLTTTCKQERGIYYALESICNGREITCCVFTKHLFDTLLTPMFLCGVVVSLSSFEKSLKVCEIFSWHFFKPSYNSTYFLSLYHFPLRSCLWKGFVDYTIKAKKKTSHRFQIMHKEIQMIHKTGFLVLYGRKIWRNGLESGCITFASWSINKLLHDWGFLL